MSKTTKNETPENGAVPNFGESKNFKTNSKKLVAFQARLPEEIGGSEHV